MERHHTASALRAQEAYYSIGFTCVISTASKHLHNDLAKAIEALEQKKSMTGENQD